MDASGGRGYGHRMVAVLASLALLLSPSPERALQLRDELVDVYVEGPEAAGFGTLDLSFLARDEARRAPTVALRLLRAQGLFDDDGLEASWRWSDRFRVYGQLSDGGVQEEAVGPARTRGYGTCHFDGGATLDLSAQCGLTVGYTRFSLEMTSSASKNDRIRSMLDGGGYFLALDLRF
jgi:hypothetical protein